MAVEYLKHLTFVGVKELAEAAGNVLRHSTLSQERGTVADYPNERSLRYYMSEGLLAQPSGKQGLNSVFGYEHLLAILAIKKLQSEGVPINLIRTLIPGKTASDLESVVGEELISDVLTAFGLPPIAAQPSASPIQFSSIEPPKAQNRAKDFLQSLLFREPEEEAVTPEVLFSISPCVEISEPPERWDRYEIEPGIELHIREGCEPTSLDDVRPKLYGLIDRILNQISR